MAIGVPGPWAFEFMPATHILYLHAHVFLAFQLVDSILWNYSAFIIVVVNFVCVGT
jgi:hypothetical protein